MCHCVMVQVMTGKSVQLQGREMQIHIPRMNERSAATITALEMQTITSPLPMVDMEGVIKTLRSSYDARVSGRDILKIIGLWPNVEGFCGNVDLLLGIKY